MDNLKIGFAMCGSYCTYASVIAALRGVKQKFENVQPIMSEHAFSTDSRFGASAAFADEIEKICSSKLITTITAAEPIGPKGLFDVLVVAPCTGNTIAKIASGITDTSVTMAVKAHLRNERPVVLAIATNDALSANAGNIGQLLNRRNIYFVPFYQDDPDKKPRSLVADFNLINEAILAATEGRQLQPLIEIKK